MRALIKSLNWGTTIGRCKVANWIVTYPVVPCWFWSLDTLESFVGCRMKQFCNYAGSLMIFFSGTHISSVLPEIVGGSKHQTGLFPVAYSKCQSAPPSDCSGDFPHTSPVRLPSPTFSGTEGHQSLDAPTYSKIPNPQTPTHQTSTTRLLNISWVLLMTFLSTE